MASGPRAPGPDIIMVGEIRDGETASLAINAALTGHLVLSTIHTNSAAGAIPRLIDMGVEPFLLVSTVKVIVGQRLVRRSARKKKNTNSRKPNGRKSPGRPLRRHDRSAHRREAREGGTKIDDVPFYHPKPSQECEEGYSGRIGIHEVLKVTSTIRDLILKGASSDAIEEEARKEGMLTMLEDGLYKAARGITSIEDAITD
jgi:type II secretory ATPase GspE/PulE/Tfp pilus assembly ATPase PilB-like protein